MTWYKLLLNRLSHVIDHKIAKIIVIKPSLLMHHIAQYRREHTPLATGQPIAVTWTTTTNERVDTISPRRCATSDLNVPNFLVGYDAFLVM